MVVRLETPAAVAARCHAGKGRRAVQRRDYLAVDVDSVWSCRWDVSRARAGGGLMILEPEAPPKKLTSADLKIGLRASKGAGHQVFFEVGNDTGSKVTRHADAVSIGIWPSTGHQV